MDNEEGVRIKEIGEEEEIGATEETVPDVAGTPPEVRLKLGEEAKVKATQYTEDQDTPPIHHLSAAGPTGFLEAKRDGARMQPRVLGRISPHQANETKTSSVLQ